MTWSLLCGMVCDFGNAIINVTHSRGGYPPEHDLIDDGNRVLAINAMSAEYGVVADGQKGIFRANWTRRSRTVSIYSLAAHWRIEAGSRILRRRSGHTGKAFQPCDVNTPIHVPGAQFFHDATDVSLIARYINGHTVELRDAATANLSDVRAKVTWPCFTATDVGKSIWIDAANPFGAIDIPRQDFIIPLRESGISPLISRISSVQSPDLATLTEAFEINSANERSTRIVWGTDNTAAILKAGAAAARSRHRYLHFEGPGLCCAFRFGHAHARVPEPMAGIAETFGALIWLGSDCESFFTDSNGTEHNKRIIPIHAPSPPVPPRNVFGGSQFPRVKATNAVNVVILGDSMSTDEVQPPQGAALSPIRHILQALQDSNGNKTFAVANFSTPGANFEHIDSFPNNFMPWYEDKERPYMDYAMRSASGAVVDPDLVILAIGGGNDAWAIKVKSIVSIIRKIRDLPKDQWGNPPDILMMNCRQESFVRIIPGSDPVDTFVDFMNWQEGREFANMLIRSVAKKSNIAFLDYESQAANVMLGWDPSNMGMINVPDLAPAAASHSSPYRLGHAVRDYACRLVINAPDGGTAWSSAGALAFQLSSKPDNVCIIGVDQAGFLTVQVNTWGFTYEVETTIERGSDELRVGQPSAENCRFWTSGAGEGGRLGRLSLDSTCSFPVGTPVLLPAHRHLRIDEGGLRTVITDPSYGGNYTIADNPTPTHVPLTGTILHGSMLFQCSDASSAADLQIEGAGLAGAPLQTKIAEVIDNTHVRLCDRAETTVTGARRIFLGRVGTPKIVSHIQAAGDAGANPAIEISITGTHLYVGYQRGTDKMVQTICRLNIERYGGVFRPLVFPLSQQQTILEATRVWVDRPIFYMPTLTSNEMWGAIQSSDYDGATGGNGGNHSANDQQMHVDVPLLRVQDFATD
jgi:hypothetical protein